MIDNVIDVDGLVRRAVREIYGSRGEGLLNSNLFDATNSALQEGIDTALAGTAKTGN
jgi:hypothetical protein